MALLLNDERSCKDAKQEQAEALSRTSSGNIPIGPPTVELAYQPPNREWSQEEAFAKKPDWEPLTTIKDSGKRMQFSSGSMRDPAEGKIKWSRITFGPMMRRWAQHLTTAEAKYPDPEPGVPNFSLIETKEELLRYRESAFRHFMSWFYNETDEDHASACFFNINGVELIKDKWKAKETHDNERPSDVGSDPQ